MPFSSSDIELSADSEIAFQFFRSKHPGLVIKYSEELHDRFMILDNKVLYHIGASLKDAGKKAFEVSIIDDEGQLQEICRRIK